MPRQPSSVDEQAQALADLDRITYALSASLERRGVRIHPSTPLRAVVEELLHTDTIRVGKRPSAAEQPMKGQTSIEEQLCEHEWVVGSKECQRGCGAMFHDVLEEER